MTSSTRVPRPARAIKLRPRSAIAVGLASFLGLVAFFWPFVVDPGRIGATETAPVLFGLLLLLVLAVLVAQIAEGGIDAKALAMLGVLSAVNAALRPLGAGTAGIETVFFLLVLAVLVAQIAEGGIDAKALAMLGVLSAVNAALRPLGAGTAGIETVFFLLVLAGRVLGPGFGFTLGCTSLFASALITGGVGPWMPYQMFGCAFVGLGAGLLPRCSGRIELIMLAAYGAVSAFAFGFLLNLSFWPFSLDTDTGISYRPGASTGTNVHRYLVFDATTSLGWDAGRAITTTTCIIVLGPAVLAARRRAARRASFDPDVTFAPHP
jgi:energy-coupling factor transport system substrate-specific component